MKTMLAMAVMMAVTLASAQDAELSGPVKNAKAQYEKALKKAQDAVGKEYIQTLTDIKDNSRDNKVQKDALIEIERVQATLGTKGTKLDPIVGKWNWGNGRVFVFTADGLCTGGTRPGKWERDEKRENIYRLSGGERWTMSKDGLRLTMESGGKTYTYTKIVDE